MNFPPETEKTDDGTLFNALVTLLAQRCGERNFVLVMTGDPAAATPHGMYMATDLHPELADTILDAAKARMAELARAMKEGLRLQ